MLILMPVALCGVLKTEVDFEDRGVRGFPRDRARPNCDVHFEVQYPDGEWIRWFADNDLPGAAPGLGPESWRIVRGDGTLLTSFVGEFAVDARPLAKELGALEDYRRGRRDPRCVRTRQHECWTASELWLYLEDWRDTNCVSE
jgi:hypothetical protein